MPTASIITVADAVVTALNDATFSQAIEAERAYMVTQKLEELSEVQVTVMPREDDGELDSRSTSRHNYTILIGVQQKPETVTNDDLDPLVLLTEEIADFFRFADRQGNAKMTSPKIAVLYNDEHLQNLGQFSAVITLTFRGWRE